METKTFGGKKIKIRKVSARDLRHVKKFQQFVNSLVEERARILLSRKKSLKEEKQWLEGVLKGKKKHKRILLVAEHNDIIIGTTGIDLDRGRKSHVAELGIIIRKGYRRIGLGKYLMGEILKLAKKELKPKPKIVKLSVYPNNKPAIVLYKKHGFKIVAKIPKQLQYKGKLLNEVIMTLEL